MASLPESKYYVLEAVAEGVYVAVSRPDSLARCNSAIVDLGDQTLIVDTFDYPAPAADLRDAAEQLTGRRPTAVINTHHHGDHVRGNQIFVDALIISTHVAWERMAALQTAIDDMRADPSELELDRRDTQERLNNHLDDAQESKALRTQLRRIEATLDALPRLHILRPTLTFERHMAFHGSQRQAKLVVPGYARTPYATHTPGDCYVMLPDDGVLIAGDIAFFGREPYMGDCDPGGWRDILRALLAAPYELVVPGHGPVGGKAELTLLREYLIAVDQLIKSGVEAGLTLDELLRRPLPDEVAELSENGTPDERNVRALYKRYAG